ncbi:MAG: sirohydrochlorin chelatase [Leptolyngbyaceae cyanobacterium bins.302]|nr:sirohydrochlorin chelatase [Leptolyngbyaceae cyanobacterium bins.302]
MQTLSVYVLVFHGSHDPRSQRAAKQLTESFRHKIQQSAHVNQATRQDLQWVSSPRRSTFAASTGFSSGATSAETSVWVQDAYLECYSLPLPQQINQFVQQIYAISDTSDTIRWRVIPVFLLAGMHVMEDLPMAIATAHTLSDSSPQLQITPHLGAHAGLKRLLNERMSALPMEAWILLAHGSRRPNANETVEQLATDLGVVTAYWSTPPSLETRIQELAAIGIRKIGILPYFLFSGGITDAIAQTVAQLALALPNLTLTLSHPLDASIPELADLLIDLAVKGGGLGVGGLANRGKSYLFKSNLRVINAICNKREKFIWSVRVRATQD